MGMSVGPIAVSEIISYWTHLDGVTPLDDFIVLMQAMDAEYLTNAAEKHKRSSKK